jgi:hypothetical protein
VTKCGLLAPHGQRYRSGWKSVLKLQRESDTQGVKAIAESVAAILFHGTGCPRWAPSAIAMAELHRLLADDVLELEIHAWVDDGGPDGEQLYCVADLVSQHLLTDADLVRQVEAIVGRDDAAVTSLRALAQHCADAGYAGACHWCLTAIAALRPAQVRCSLTSIGAQRRGPCQAPYSDALTSQRIGP